MCNFARVVPAQLPTYFATIFYQKITSLDGTEVFAKAKCLEEWV